MNTSWQRVCKDIVQARGYEESAQSWPIQPGAAVPFEHRWQHVCEVVKLARWLSAQIEQDDKTDKWDIDAEVVEAAAWLHDIDKAQPNHAAISAVEAVQILSKTDFPTAKLEQVARAIRQHEGMYRQEGADPIEPIEAAILWDADKLSKLGVQALVYGLCTHYFIGKTLQERRKEEQEWVHDVLSKTAYSMNTAPAERLAVRRYREMVATLETWAREESESIIVE